MEEIDGQWGYQMKDCGAEFGISSSTSKGHEEKAQDADEGEEGEDDKKDGVDKREDNAIVKSTFFTEN